MLVINRKEQLMSDGFNYVNNNCNEKIFSYEGKIYLTSKNEKTQELFNKILSVFDKNHNRCLDSDEIKSIWNKVCIKMKHMDENSDGVMSRDEMRKLIDRFPLIKNLKITADELIQFLNIIEKTVSKSLAKLFAKAESRLSERLKSKYPQDKYEIKKTSDTTIEIYDKKTNYNIVTCNIDLNGRCSITYKKDGQPYREEFYNSAGHLEHYSEASKMPGNGVEWKNGDPISDIIYKDVTAKTKLGLPTTGKDIEKHIKQITPDNIIHILQHYEARYGETLLEAIEGEWGLDSKVKEKLKRHLNKCLVQTDFWDIIKPNTKLDQDFSQGQTGDCWFLASIAAVKRSPKGQKILDNTIKDNGDGTYTVKFKGANKEYTVSALEIISKNDYASGDKDVRILEIAANKHYLTGIVGGNPAEGLELLLGTDDKWKNVLRHFSPKASKEKIAELLKNPNMVITTAIAPWSKLFGIVMRSVDDREEYKNDIATAHGYAIVGIDDKNIYLINPWYTYKKIAVPLEVFEDYWANVQYTEIK